MSPRPIDCHDGLLNERQQLEKATKKSFGSFKKLSHYNVLIEGEIRNLAGRVGVRFN